MIREGYESNFNGEAYSSVCFQNANLSVRVTDDFMDAVRDKRSWQTRWISNKVRGDAPSYDAKELLNKMAECAWHCGDPGVQYDTTINRWHTCPNSGAINASNPCSEYMFLDDTACNLASINLMKFVGPDGSFEVDRFRAAARLFFIAQEILVDHASYPTEPIAANSHRFRPLGLGYSNLGSVMMSRGLPYDSDAARGLCGSLTALMHGEANRTSAELAGVVGPFDGYSENEKPMLGVMQMHREACDQIDDEGPEELKAAAKKLWDDVLGNRREVRFPQRPGDRVGTDRHDQLHDGLRHHGHRARHRAGQVQAARRRRDAQDRQSNRPSRPAEAWLRPGRDRGHPEVHRRE